MEKRTMFRIPEDVHCLPHMTDTPSPSSNDSPRGTGVELCVRSNAQDCPQAIKES